MKKFLRILIFLLVLIMLLAIAAMFLAPKKLTLAESTTVDAPPTLVYNLVNDFKKWETWSPWEDLDPNVVNSYSEKSSGVGARRSWKGNKNVGEGTQKIIATEIGKSIDTELEFNGFDGVSKSNWLFEEDNGKTKVTWDFNGAETGLVFRPFNWIMKGALKKNYALGLSRIKDIAETRAQKKEYRGFKINEITLPEKYYLINRQEVEMANVQQFYSRALPALFGKATKAGVELNGMPGGLFYKWDELNKKTDMAASIPVKEPYEIEGTTLQTIPAGKAIQVDYYGDFENSANAHYAIDDYLKDYGLQSNVPIVEEYVTDPTQEKDPNKWLTKITYYIP